MIRGLYSAGSAVNLAALNQDVAAENMANATTPGYRRQGLRVEPFANGPNPDGMGDIRGAQSAGSYTSFAPGPILHTGNDLDLSINGDAFFTLEGPQGTVYTRNGSFEINSTGELQTPNGLRLQGSSGRIVVPVNAAKITIAPDGSVLADNVEVGRLQLARFADPTSLERVGTTLFRGSDPQQPPPGTARIEQGYREGSNVQVVQEMVTMMIGMRQYEASEKAMRALAEAVGMSTRQQS